jgi:hypothetical protein
MIFFLSVNKMCHEWRRQNPKVETPDEDSNDETASAQNSLARV